MTQPDAQAPTRTTSNGRVTIPNVVGPGWLIEETISDAPRATVMKCKRAAVPNEFFFMIAKTYEVAPDQAVPADQLTNVIFRRNHERMFDAVHYASTGWIEVRGVQWYEALMEMKHSARGLLAKVERTCVVGPKVYVLSGEGAQADMRTYQAVLARWLAESSFMDLVFR